MTTPITSTSPSRHPWRRLVAGLASVSVTAAGVAGVAITTAAPAHAAPIAVDDAELVWGINTESTAAGFAPGTWNLFSAGKVGNPGAGGQTLNSGASGSTWSNGSAANWKATDGNVTIQDKQPDGTYATTTWTGTRQNSAGTTSNTSGITGENRISIAGGTGTLDPAANTAEIGWDGDFSVIYYSGMTFFYASDPELTVNADGSGEVTARVSGYGTDMEDPTQWVEIAPAEVTLATLTGVDVTASGITTTPSYRGVEYDAPPSDVGQVRTGDNWGAFPQDFIDFQTQTGQSSYWYSSGGAADVRKPATELKVARPAPAVRVSKTTLLPDGAQEITVTGTGFDPTAATGTRPPLAGKPAGAYVVFGKFAETWRPSAGAPGANRVNSAQKWAVSAADMATVGGPAAGAIELTPEGTFTTTLTVDKAAIDAKATASNLVNYGVYTYPGSGATNAAYETYTPITYAAAASSVTVSAPVKTYGQAATATVRVAGEGGNTGQVTLKRGSATVGTATLFNGSATFSLGRLPAGSHPLTAAYAGTVNSRTGTGSTVQRVSKASTSSRPTVPKKPKVRKPGQAQVRVSGAAGAGEGKATFVVKNSKNKRVVSKTGVLNASGIAKVTLPRLKKGNYKVSVSYPGNANLGGSSGTSSFRVR